ncbi:NUDIX hydrolase [Reyranella soli]|jgi:8-oxo-dGTP pyrophosphatase MutT (NUDIX family)|uniref:DNA mismatch repair protein MutT n=1 Tax=Reyranella soli TaxID=1230389 RepID=A0A512NK90_9HYPH|nr:NUDIX domain-containing protein [Reyranella soli]GEP59342.1 DNA mismatch repair protein MutT [Reyranella soli]
MRRRLSARFLILDQAGRILLFRFVYKRGPLAGQDFWGTPGGGVEDGETLEQAALRELVEETGLRRDSVGPEVARREVVLQLPDGEHVVQDERFFVVRVTDNALSKADWTDLEREVMVEHRWWSLDELAQTEATVWPKNLREMIGALP